jgi:ribonuclease T2
VIRALRRGLAAVALVAGIGNAAAQDIAGDFDFYVLSLSWSPTYCATAERPSEEQCSLHLGFTVHGLWPQYESGYPEFCEAAESPFLRMSTISEFADLFPDPDLAKYQWRKHGLCSGLRQNSYFALIRRAVEKVVVPKQFVGLKEDVSIGPRAIEGAFIAANPGLSARGISVTCRRGKLEEVRLCLGRDLAFRRCEQVDADTCRESEIDVAAPH